jgi:hypothetical protein
MRLVFLLIVALVLSSSSCQQVVESNPEKEEVSETTGTLAVVTTEFSDEGCPFLLEIEENGKKVLLMPIELDEEFKKDGLRVSIEFHFSRIMQSECQKGRPIVLDSINLVG